MNDVHVSDPHHVPEILISGPVNIKRIGGFLLITLTAARAAGHNVRGRRSRRCAGAIGRASRCVSP